MYIALLVVMVFVRYPTKEYLPPGVRMRGLGITTGIHVTTPPPVQTKLHMTVPKESDQEHMEGVM